MRRDELLTFIPVFEQSADLDDEALGSALRAVGADAVLAERLVVFLPLAFGRVILEEIGASSFPTSFSARNASGTWVSIPIAREPIYRAALELAREARVTGVVPRAAFKAVALRSPELNAAIKALNAGSTLRGATFSTALIGLRAEEYGWRSALGRVARRLTRMGPVFVKR